MTAQWSRVGASGEELRAALGPSASDEDSRAVTRQLTDLDTRGVIHWADLPLAQAWIDRAVSLSADYQTRRVENFVWNYETSDDPAFNRAGNGTLADQEAAVVALWEAIGRAYQALDLPPVIDPAYRASWLGRTQLADTRAYCDRGAWVAALGRTGRLYVADDRTSCVTIENRVALGFDGALALNLAAQGRGWDSVLANTEETADWRTWSFQHEAVSGPDGGVIRYDNRVRPPLRWYWDLGQEIARSLAARGPARVVLEGERNAFILNVRAAADAGLLSSLARMDIEAADVAAIGAASADELSGGHGERGLDVLAGAMGSAAIAAGTYLGPIGIVAGALLGVGAAIIELWNYVIPHARQVDADPWGRRRPVFEAHSITGGDANHPPTQTVPDPPNWHRPLVLYAVGVPFYAPRADAPRADAPRADAPRADAPRADAPRADAPRADAVPAASSGAGEVLVGALLVAVLVWSVGRTAKER